MLLLRFHCGNRCGSETSRGLSRPLGREHPQPHTRVAEGALKPRSVEAGGLVPPQPVPARGLVGPEGTQNRANLLSAVIFLMSSFMLECEKAAKCRYFRTSELREVLVNHEFPP